MDAERLANPSSAQYAMYANSTNPPRSQFSTGIDTDQQQQPLIPRIYRYIKNEATFFRIHLAAFTFIPLIASGIFYASNGTYHIKFLDSMFLCYSAMTVTGLSTVNLSTITTWQQFILYFLMGLGDITIVSWFMVLIRKRFFRTHCEYIMSSRTTRLRSAMRLKSRGSFMKTISGPIISSKRRQSARPSHEASKMPSRVDSMTTGTTAMATGPQVQLISPTPMITRANTITEENEHEHGFLDGDGHTFSSSPRSQIHPLPGEGSPRSPGGTPLPFDGGARSPPAIEFAPFTMSPRSNDQRTNYQNAAWAMRDRRGVPFPKRAPTILTNTNIRSPTIGPGSPTSQRTHHNKYQGFGGFPGPAQLIHGVVKITAPHAYGRLERKMTLPTFQTIESTTTPWLKSLNELVVGRNSDFHTETLTDDELEEVGGAEYRALRLLSYLVPFYFVCWQLFSVLLFLPYLVSTKKYDSVFQDQPKLVSKQWFGFFQVMAAYTGGGMSLVDQGMLPFQNASWMIIALIFVILAGNHALPIFLRLFIWIASRVLPNDSEAQDALSFLLDHPRRCFLYLFPSHQTWFLVICLVIFSTLEWVSFLVLNIGLPDYESVSVGTRVLEGLFQGLAARASGFAIVPLANLAPALQFLYVVMMYIAIYPVALSIRSTNVYEERSLGVFEAPPDEEDEEPDDLNKLKSRRERVGRYVGWHMRRQMSIDIWWLVWAVFLVAIIERKNILDQDKKWFDMFRVLFELVSAFGGIGLSLGFPSDNYSFVGAMSPLSKLVVIIIMVRGRHRGLPVAVDRAVLLPSELVTNNQNQPNQSHGPTSILDEKQGVTSNANSTFESQVGSPPISLQPPPQQPLIFQS